MPSKAKTEKQATTTTDTEATAPVEEMNVEEEKTPRRAADNSIYTVDDFADASYRLFGKNIGPDIVNAAFMVDGTKKCTIAQAKRIVKDFITGEVK